MLPEIPVCTVTYTYITIAHTFKKGSSLSIAPVYNKHIKTGQEMLVY